jgi:hypothetical protein
MKLPEEVSSIRKNWRFRRHTDVDLFYFPSEGVNSVSGFRAQSVFPRLNESCVFDIRNEHCQAVHHFVSCLFHHFVSCLFHHGKRFRVGALLTVRIRRANAALNFYF